MLAAEASCQGGQGSIEELDYTVLAARTLGEHGPILVDVSIVTVNFGAVCSYIILIGSLTSSMLGEWSATSIAPGTVDVAIAWWESFYFVAPVMVLFFVFPPCLVRHFSNLRYRRGDFDCALLGRMLQPYECPLNSKIEPACFMGATVYGIWYMMRC